MPHIRRQGEHVTANVVTTIGTRFQGTRSKRMTQVHEPWSWSLRVRGNARGRQELMEGIDDREIAQWAPPAGHEHVIIVQRQCAPFGQVSLQRRGRRRMQGHQTALPELRFANYQAIRGDVLEPERERLGDPQSRHSQQAQEGAVGMGAQRVRWPETGGLREEGLEVLLAKEVWNPSPPLAIKQPSRWHLMARVFRVAKAGEPDDNAQTVMALGFRGALVGPRDRGVGDNVGVALCGGKLRKAAQIALHGIELKVRRSANRQVRLNSLYQHNAPSGHGLATCCRRSISTLA